MSLFGMGLRLVDRRDHAQWLERQGSHWPRAVALALAATLIITALGSVADVWTQMATAYVLLIPLTAFALPLDWARLRRPSVEGLVTGLLSAIVLYGCGALTLSVISRVPSLAAQLRALHAWKQLHPLWVGSALLVLVIVPGEEIVWRAGVTLPLAGRLGPFWGCLAGAAAFTAAHLGLGVGLLLLAAFAAGLFWSLLVVKTRSLVPALVCHLLWDLVMLFSMAPAS
jgi:uncharacterized protein